MTSRNTTESGYDGAFQPAPEHFRLLVESVQDYGIFLLDLNGRVASWNRGAERIRGYSREDVLGRHVAQFFPAEAVERGEPARALEVAAREGRHQDEGWRVRKDGTRFWAHVVTTALRGAHGELVGYVKVTRDLTERRRAEVERERLLRREHEARVAAEGLAEQLEQQSAELEIQLEELQNQAVQLEENQVELEMANDELERAKAELTSAEAHYRRLVEASPYGVFVLDPDGRFTEVNGAGARILGRTEEEMLGRHFGAMIASDDLERARGTFERVLAGQDASLEVELRVRRPSAEPRLVNVVITAIREHGGVTGVHGVSRDVTEERQTQEALQESEASYRSLFDNLTELVYIQDLEGRFLNVNEAVLRRYGYSREEIIGHQTDLLADFTLTGRGAAEASFRAAGGGVPQRFELWGRTRDGERFPKEITLARGRYFGQDVVIGVARDISERKQAEMAVERSRDFYMSIFDRVPALIWRSDDGGGCDFFNRAWLEFTGRELEQELGDGWMEGVHPEDLEECLRTYRDAFEAREPFELEYRLRHHSGEYRWIVDLGRPLHDLEDRFIGYIGGGFDIHEHRRVEQQLRQAQKMEAVGQLAGGIAHDFNNVLAVIKGRSAIALMDIPQDSELYEDVTEIDHATNRAANLTSQLLAFSRQQVLQPRVLNLNEVVSEMEKMLGRTLGEDIEFVTVLDPAAGRVRADPGQVEQILMNLAVNARDAMPTGGKLITETRNVELTESYAEQFGYEVRPGPYVLLSVSDTGAGMPRSVQERIFEPFFTTKPKGKGTGMGLSTVFGIVKQSGGYIWVYSEPGQGTTFKIYLPRVDAEASASGEPGEGVAAPRRVTVLLVEDEPAVRSTARRMLERMGHTVLDAGNGEEALRVAEAHPGEIDLLLTDVVMPLMGGRVLVERLSQERPGLRVLYTSGYTDEAVVRNGIMEGSAAFLQKPYQPAALAAKIAAILEPSGTSD